MNPKRLFIITGTGSGIGKSLAEYLCSDSNHYVIGLSRTNVLTFPNFNYHSLDLSDIESVKSFQFPEFENVDSICLINNAGTLGEVITMDRIGLDSIERTINVNYTATMILSTLFLHQYQHISVKNKTIISISSGAASSPYASWTNYCSSKAAIEMMTRCIHLEQVHQPYPVRVLAVAPGVVDTAMQKTIRSTPNENFSQKIKFEELYRNNQLYSTHDVAVKIADVAINPSHYSENIFRIVL